jgi:pimeloyl-ACP methyl ester carboxylesterase
MIPPRNRIVIAASHGVLTGLTNPSWNIAFKRFVDTHPMPEVAERVCVQTQRYASGALPPLNYFLRNPFLARSLANELEPYAEEGCEIAFVGHSNGTDINLRAAKILAGRGYHIRSMVLIGSVVHEDVDHSGISWMITNDILGRPGLGRAFAYCSKADYIVRSRIIWPYQNLGSTGFQRYGRPYENSRLVTRWHGGGHSGYLATENHATAFPQILEDLLS